MERLAATLIMFVMVILAILFFVGMLNGWIDIVGLWNSIENIFTYLEKVNNILG